MLILTYADADNVRGLTVRGHAIVPVPLADGTLALPETVASDPFHAIRWAYLATLDRTNDSLISPGIPTIAVPNAPVTNSDWEQSTTIRAMNAFSTTWQVGQLIAVAAPST